MSRDVNGARLTLWTAPTLDPAIAEQTLDVAADALRYYNDRFGAYPAREIDLVQTDPSGALGIAWAGLLFLDGPALLGTYGDPIRKGWPRSSRTSGASLVGHPGGRGLQQARLHPGRAGDRLLAPLPERGPRPEAAARPARSLGDRPRAELLAAGDAVVDVPVAEGQDENIRSAATYGKGSLGFLAIRQEIGAEAFKPRCTTWPPATPGAR